MADFRERQTNSRNGQSSHGRQGRDHEPRERRSRSPSKRSALLPFEARHLSKTDLTHHKTLFGLYLDVQKGLDIDALDFTELRGRWKSFIGKWNRGELAEGWYDPQTKQKSDQSRHSNDVINGSPVEAVTNTTHVSDEEDDYGPSLPAHSAGRSRPGPAIPNLQDIQDRAEQAAEDEEHRRDDLRYARKNDRKLQTERLDEIAPRAEPGTKERQLEKKREAAAANRAFRETRSPGAEEVGERDMMGDNGIEGYKAQMKAAEKRKSERELRKEEASRARAAEREERVAEHRAKEEKTMDMLRALAKSRFG